MQWMIELGRVDIDIATEFFMLSSHNYYPRGGHFEAALHIVSYLKVKHNVYLDLDPSYPTIDCKNFKDND